MARYHYCYDDDLVGPGLHLIDLNDEPCLDHDCGRKHFDVYGPHDRGAYLDVEHDDGTVDHWHAFHIVDEPRPYYLDLVGDQPDDVGGGGAPAGADSHAAEHGDGDVVEAGGGDQPGVGGRPVGDDQPGT